MSSSTLSITWIPTDSYEHRHIHMHITRILKNYTENWQSDHKGHTGINTQLTAWKLTSIKMTVVKVVGH